MVLIGVVWKKLRKLREVENISWQENSLYIGKYKKQKGRSHGRMRKKSVEWRRTVGNGKYQW